MISRTYILTLTFFLLTIVFIGSPAQAQLIGTDTAPGDSCASYPQGATRVTADADQDGAHVILICDGTTWNAVVGAGSAPTLATIVDARYSTGDAFPDAGPISWDFTTGTAAAFLHDGVTGSGGVNYLKDICALELSELSLITSIAAYDSGGDPTVMVSPDGVTWHYVSIPPSSWIQTGATHIVGIVAKYVGITELYSGAARSCRELTVEAYEWPSGGGGGGGGASALDDLSDVDTAGKSVNDVLTWNGAGWEAAAASGGGGGGSGNTYAFRASGGSTTSNSTVTVTNLVQDYDPNNIWDESGSSDQFKPTEAGDYYVYMLGFGEECEDGSAWLKLLKNGSIDIGSTPSGAPVEAGLFVSAVVPMNGTTDNIRFQATDLGACSRVTGIAVGGFKINGGGGGADNLGNHTATQNVALGDFFISGDGDDEGLRLETDGTARFSYELIANGKFQIESANPFIEFDTTTGGPKGCIRYDDATDKLQYANDCSTYSDLGGGALADLTDVDTAGVVAGDVLLYSAGGWVAGAAIGGIESVPGLDPPPSPETDPQVGVLTSGKWCTSDGTSVNCAADPPSGAPSCTRRTANASGSTVTVSCNSGEVMTGGGCYSSSGSHTIEDSYPSADDTWHCEWSGTGSTRTVYAICCTF